MPSPRLLAGTLTCFCAPAPAANNTLPPTETTPAVRLLQAGDRPQRRRLAAARRAQQGEQLARLDLEADVVDGEDPAAIAVCRRLLARERRFCRSPSNDLTRFWTSSTSVVPFQTRDQSCLRPTLAPSL